MLNLIKNNQILINWFLEINDFYTTIGLIFFSIIECALLLAIIVYFCELIYKDFFTFKKNYIIQLNINLLLNVINSICKIIAIISLFFFFNFIFYDINIINSVNKTSELILITNFFKITKLIGFVKLLICFLTYNIIKSLKFTINKLAINHTNFTLEFPFLFFFVLFFLLIICGSNTLIGLYLGIVGYSILIYLLMLNNSKNENTREATIKYFILSGLSSGLFIWGILAIHCAIGDETNFQLIASKINQILLKNIYNEFDTKNMFLLYGLVLIIFSFLFKLTAFPASLWVQDVYIGCTYPVLCILLMPAKLAIFVGFARLLTESFYALNYIWEPILIFAAAGSMLFGALNALNELHIKKFLAYSSITHMGYILLGLTGDYENSFVAAMYYFIIYIFTSLPFLLLLTWAQPFKLTTTSNTNPHTSKFYTETIYFLEFEKIRISNPWAADIFIVIIYAMSGMPPFATFIAKVLILETVYNNYLTTNYIILILFVSLISTYYYIKLLKIFLFNNKIELNVNLKKNDIYFSNNLPLIIIISCIYFITFGTIFFDIFYAFIESIILK